SGNDDCIGMPRIARCAVCLRGGREWDQVHPESAGSDRSRLAAAGRYEVGSEYHRALEIVARLREILQGWLGALEKAHSIFVRVKRVRLRASLEPVLDGGVN